MSISKYSRKPKSQVSPQTGRYEIFNLKENPFPSSPFVNPESSDARNNGDIYESSIREKENEAIEENFLKVPQSDSNHLRLGYILDTSYIGRGNGKSAFLVNLQKKINKDFALSVSNELNKCFAIVIVPEPGGKTKTFESFVELFVERIFASNIVEDGITTLKLEAVMQRKPDIDVENEFKDDLTLKEKLNSFDWYKEQGIEVSQMLRDIASKENFQELPKDFPIFSNLSPLFPKIPCQKDFEEYYKSLKRGKPKFDFLFSHLVSLFLASGFNGAYIFVDDFERIPDFQSERQKINFALELRTCLFDGLYTSARTGFYNLILVLHAGVPRLIQSAWEQSGLENRSPILFLKGTPKNVIRFEKISLQDAEALILKYLQEYKIDDNRHESEFYPFEKSSIAKISELSEFNASKILKMSYEVLERAVEKRITTISEDFIAEISEANQSIEERQVSGISEAGTKDLLRESD